MQNALFVQSFWALKLQGHREKERESSLQSYSVDISVILSKGETEVKYEKERKDVKGKEEGKLFLSLVGRLKFVTSFG